VIEPDGVLPGEPAEAVTAAEPIADAGGNDGATGESEKPDEPGLVEGPRRRERRERAERRAAQARATAIEQARREAKRAARGRGEGGPHPTPLRAGRFAV